MKKFTVYYSSNPTPVTLTGRWKVTKTETYCGREENLYFEIIEKVERGFFLPKKIKYSWEKYQYLRITEEIINECSNP